MPCRIEPTPHAATPDASPLPAALEWIAADLERLSGPLDLVKEDLGEGSDGGSTRTR